MSTPPPQPEHNPEPYGAGGPQVPPPPPQQGGYTYEESQASPVTRSRPKDSFFDVLFDLNFDKYLTLRFAKVIYILMVAFIILTYLVWIIVGFAAEVWLGFLILFLGWIPVAINIVLTRVGLEFMVAMIKTAENTSIMAQNK
ncbi:MAG TPA: DUF4282 domain-containing protein [Beutenbergiaceae bacterium]|nr:DUF4282 domain-containing protein [Beutenbergiaceae bacterium]